MRAIGAPLVEREREVEALERVLAAARQGEGGAAVVEGPAGIGKSRLLAAAAVQANDLEVLRARASELEREFPFGVVRQLFEPVLVRADSGERERLLMGAGALAERVLAGSPTENGRDARDAFAVLHGLYWFAANLATSRPVLLLVDDAQWSDGASLRWLAFLLRRLEGVRLALLMAVRSGESGAEEALVDELVSDPVMHVIRPSVLSDSGVAELLTVALGTAPADNFLAACQRATGGNPFLLRELLVELAEHRMTPSPENAALVERLGSSGVGRSLRGRLRRLPPECLQLARAVAVLGDGCALAAAAQLAELDEAPAAAGADALAAASIFEPSRPLAFVHPLVRASVYGELAAGERSAWHARAARALTRARADPDRVAVHLLACEPTGDPATVETLREAADSARCRDAHEVTATYLRRALREPPPPKLEPQLLRELGSAELQTGQIEPALEHLRRALAETSEAAQRGLVALDLANGLLFTDQAPDAVDVLSGAIDGLSDQDAELAAQLMAMRALAGLSSLGAYRRLPPQPHTPILGGSSPRTTGERLQLGQQALREMLTGTAAEARSLALRALGDRQLLEATGTHYPPFYLPLNALMWAHAFEDAERHLQAALADARRRGSEVGFAVTSHFRAALGWQRGALGELEADARAALALNAPFAFPLAAVHLADALVERGDPETAASQLREGRLDARTPAPLMGVLALAARAHVRLGQQRPEKALALLLECGRLEQAWQIGTPSLTHWRAEAAVLFNRLGERERARHLAADAVVRADAFGSPVARGIALRAAALVAQPPDHDGLTAAVAVLQDSGARLEFARALIELGAALRRSGRRADARDHLRAGLEVAIQCGADVLAARAHDELVAAGARPRRDPIESRSTLTASELRVARMAAEGMTNREIAQALFLTEKTIEVHLTRAYRKLEIRSRSQLPRALPNVGAPRSPRP